LSRIQQKLNLQLKISNFTNASRVASFVELRQDGSQDCKLTDTVTRWSDREVSN